MIVDPKRAGWVLGVALAAVGPLLFASCQTGNTHPLPANAAGVGGGGGSYTVATAGGAGAGGIGGAGGLGGAGGRGGTDAGAGGNPGLCNTTAPTACTEDGGSQPVQSCALALPSSYGCNPPTSGNYYLSWAAYGDYSGAVPPGYYVHNLQHGGIAILYNRANCLAFANDFPGFKAHVDGLLVEDGGCSLRRLILMEDPSLKRCFGASAWGVSITSNCFDTDALDAFVAAYYAKGPAPNCENGTLGTPDGTDGGDAGPFTCK